MALSQQDLDQAYQYVLSKGLSIQSLDDGGTDLSRMYLAPIIEYSAAGTAAKLVRLAVTLLKAKELELQRSGDGVQWRREGESWNNLFTLLEIKGDPGDYPVLRVTNKGIEGKLSSEPNEAFTLLVPYETIRLTFEMLTEEQKDEIRFHFSDFTDENKAELMKPALDAAADARTEMDKISGEVDALKGQAEIVILETTEAKEAAESATEHAQSVLDHPGYIGSDFHVYVWDYTTGAYRKTDTILRPEAFNIYRTYRSVALMEADAANVPEGKFVIINTGSVEDEDTGRLYVKTATDFEYLVDISGMRGFTGKTPQFSIGTITTGDTPDITVSEDGTDDAGNPKYKLNFILQRGPRGFTPELSIGTVTTGSPGTVASAEFVDDGNTPEGAPRKKLNLTIPQGQTGSVEGVYQTQTIDHVPGEDDLTFDVAGKTYLFRVGNELRYFNTEKEDYVFYKLYDLKDGKAVWKLAGSGGSDDGIIFLSAPEDFETSYIEIKDGGLGGL